MRLRYRDGAPLYGKTLQTVLGEAALPGDRRRPTPSRPETAARRSPSAVG